METVFSKAADVIRERGWTQNEWLSNRGEVCLMAAGVYASGDFLDFCGGIRKRFVDEYEAINWNNTPERTVEDVLTLLKELHVEAGGS